MTEGRSRVRALGVGDLLDETFGLYRQHFGFFVPLAAIIYLPIDVLQMVLQIALGTTSGGRGDGLNVAAAAGSVLVALLAAIALFIVYGAFVVATAELYHGRRTTLRGAYRAVTKRFWSLLGVVLLVGSAVVGMGVTVIGIPFAIHFSVAWAFVFQVLLLEHAPVVQSMIRSRGLVRGRWWRVFGIFLLVGLLQLVLGFVVGIPSIAVIGFGPALGFELLASVVMPIVSALTSAASQIFIQPLGFIASVLLYYDLRVRKEGYDLALRVESLSSALPVPAE